jgi:hypothetical protein
MSQFIPCSNLWSKKHLDKSKTSAKRNKVKPVASLYTDYATAALNGAMYL